MGKRADLKMNQQRRFESRPLPVSACEPQRGGIASDAASQSDDEDSSIACFVKFSSAKLGKMNGQQFVMN